MENRIKLSDLGREPFRIFFPQGVLCGITGVSLWPLYFSKVVALYPGQNHARIMVCGLFGAFIFGFLGTAMPRLLSVPPLGTRNVLLLFALHLAMLVAFVLQKMFVGDLLFLALVLVFLCVMGLRLKERKDTPPPGFILVGLAFLCVIAGGIISLFEPWMEEAGAYWIPLQRRLTYEGFVLLPILGIGPFLLPRFFGVPSGHDFPEALRPSTPWKRKAALAFGVGALIIGSFFVESAGWLRTAYALRFGITLLYLLLEFPFRSAPRMNNALGLALRIAFGALVSGFILIALFPAFRVGLLHLTLIGGFAVITFTVATRVMFGHSGNLEKLKRKNWWLAAAVGVMLFAMATRISGDFWPKIMATHYSYGAVLW
ncbi:MAG TPA: NnrS family protein, partial [Candidatus Dormibacteraeota bacterium]|nr:NnrS family protein [Candidatus Dormibacteraeota bacterium]